MRKLEEEWLPVKWERENRKAVEIQTDMTCLCLMRMEDRLEGA
jgi:hypothetical protein